jgi:hypothetical protein
MSTKVRLKYPIICVVMLVVVIVVGRLYTSRVQCYNSTFFSMDTLVEVDTFGEDLTESIQFQRHA